FDRHQLIYSEGLVTESFLPGPTVLSDMERDVLDEITGLFPELDPATGHGYSPAARPLLKSYETQVLFAPL
ncbi:MAG: 2,3,4,5-tetrahydropyridine-2,6-carboxylate N-succinyltransferase, partial [Pseudomonadota bacterium]